ncbi:electron transport complex subunit RsxC [Bacteroidales bacterium OttesenSCG-928-C19]|nr:electron transport complex subunit RsxC [Bacteroidales bacterium OttesenSCG-928-C19]
MKTFKIGGVHPEDNKLAAANKVEFFPLPKQGIIFTTQHLGAPAVPVVAKGDTVKVGQLVARAEGFMCANIHSPYSGTVAKIDTATDMFGFKKEAIYINVEGDEWDESIDTSNNIVREIKLSQSEIIEKIKEMGIVGLGGACFPTHIKYMIPEGKKADTLIINAVECEPYLTSDHRLMMDNGEEAMIGIRILMKALGVDKAYIGIEKNKPDAIERMQQLCSGTLGVEVVPLKLKYPQGAEKQLIDAITGRRVPSGKLPIDVGCVVNNIGTAFSVYEAVQKNKPLIDCILTVTGKALPAQKNYSVRIGTTYNDLLNSISPLPENIDKIISGGPMMGKAIVNMDAPIAKGAASVLVMTGGESLRGEELNCIRCGKCVQVCPMGLEPYLLSSLAEKSRIEDLLKEKMMDCIECGCCLFTCPANKPLLDSIRLGKAVYRKSLQQKK